MVQITINIPDDLAQRLEPFQAQVSQQLELGLQEFESQKQPSNFLDEQEIITLLASQPTTEQILAIGSPLPTMLKPGPAYAKSLSGQG
jgi:hypothetical protein